MEKRQDFGSLSHFSGGNTSYLCLQWHECQTAAIPDSRRRTNMNLFTLENKRKCSHTSCEVITAKTQMSCWIHRCTSACWSSGFDIIYHSFGLCVSLGSSLQTVFQTDMLGAHVEFLMWMLFNQDQTSVLKHTQRPCLVTLCVRKG